MKTSHIKNVVLYAKNFYRHTDDVVKDMQRFMQMDGHSYKSINTPEKVWKVMRQDYLDWINSLADMPNYLVDYPYLLNDIDDGVSWADGVAAHIWHILIIYSGSYIPMNAKYLGYPKYDQYHMPQFNIDACLFDRTKSFEDWNKAAKDFLDVSQEDRCVEYMNILMEKYPFERLARIFNEIGDHTSEGELQDELWDLYTKFMDENTTGDGSVTLGFFNLQSTHFYLSINGEYGGADFSVEAIFTDAIYTIPGKLSVDNISQLFKMAEADNQLLADYEAYAKKTNEVFDNMGFHSINEEHTKAEYAIDIISSMRKEIEENYVGHYDNLDKYGKLDVKTGYFQFNVKVNEDNIELRVQLTHIFDCSIMEQELRTSFSICIAGKKY